MKTGILVFIIIFGLLSPINGADKILDQFEKAGIWKVDRLNHRCLMDSKVWTSLPFEKKEQILQVIYVEEKTWWKIYDRMSGKLLGEVSSWGWKLYP